MSSSNGRAGLLRVLPRGDENGALVDLARWQPASPSTEDGTALRVDAFEGARHTGYQEGYQAARAEMETAAETDRGRLRSALADAAVAVGRTRVEAVATVTADVVDLALDLAQAFLQRELTLSDSVNIEAVSRALGLAPAGEDFVVRLHPEHGIELAEIEALAPGVTVKIIEDPAIERGGCVLEVGPCRIDSQIAPAIQRARALLAGAAATEENQP